MSICLVSSDHDTHPISSLWWRFQHHTKCGTIMICRSTTPLTVYYHIWIQYIMRENPCWPRLWEDIESIGIIWDDPSKYSKPIDYHPDPFYCLSSWLTRHAKNSIVFIWFHRGSLLSQWVDSHLRLCQKRHHKLQDKKRPKIKTVIHQLSPERQYHPCCRHMALVACSYNCYIAVVCWLYQLLRQINYWNQAVWISLVMYHADELNGQQVMIEFTNKTFTWIHCILTRRIKVELEIQWEVEINNISIKLE